MRIFRHAPGFAAAASLTLAAGIGAVVTMSVVYWAVVARPVRLPDPDRVVSIAREQRDPQVPTTLSWPRVQALRAGAHAFSAIGAYSNESVSLSGTAGVPRELRGLRVSGGFFEALGVSPLRGRLLRPTDDEPNGPAVCVLSYETWQSVFGGADLTGQAIRLGGRPTEVVGILGPHVSAPWGDRDVFLPRVFEDSQLTSALVSAGASYLSVVARLAPGRSLAQAALELRAFSRQFRTEFAGRSDTINDAVVTPLSDTVIGKRDSTLALLLAAVALVLIIANANVAALVLSRLASRRRDLAVRQSLGASRVALVRHIVADTGAIAAVAGVVGLGIAVLGLHLIVSTLGTLLPPGADLRMGAPAWVITALTVAGTVVLTGVMPALYVTRGSQAAGVTAFSRGSSEGARTHRFRRALVVGEVALSTCLLVGASLFIASLQRSLRSDVGFEPAGLAAASLTPPSDAYAGPDAQRAFFLDVLDRLDRDGRVKAAAIAFGLPFANDNYVSPYVISGRVIPPPAERRRAGLRIVTEDYAVVMGLRVVAGRFFTAADTAGGHQVCVVNRSFARHEFADRPALGAVVLRGREANQPFEIVGIVDDVKTNGPNNPAPDELFLPFRQVPRANAWLVAKTDGRADALAPVMQSAVAAVNRDLPLAGFTTMADALAGTLGPERILAGLTTVFAIVALLLASIGLYAVLAHAVTARTMEIGIRMAIGAGRGSILWMIAASAMKLVVTGIACGLLAAAATSPLVTAQLHDVSARDPYVYALVAGVFTGVGLLAAVLPARRATRVDPLVTLKA